MRPFNFNKKPQRNSEEFRTALREAGFGSTTAAIRCARVSGPR
jgi:hypothetical protein